MRKFLVVGVVSLAAALALPSLAFATHSNGQGPAQDFLSGSAKGPVATPFGAMPGQFHSNGQAQDNVTNVATGHFFTVINFNPPAFGVYTTAEFSGDVQCVNSSTVPDNAANWSAVVTDVVLTDTAGQKGPGIPGILFPGMGIVSRHVDVSPTSPDRALGFTTPTPVPCTHPTLSTPFNTLPITQGNLITHAGA